MGGGIPVVVHVFMAALAAIRFHEKFAGDMSSADYLSRAGEKCSLGSISFCLHSKRSNRRVLNHVTCQPVPFAQRARGNSNTGCNCCEQNHGSHSKFCQPQICSDRQPAGQRLSSQYNYGQRCHCNVQVKPFQLGSRGPGKDQRNSQSCANHKKQPSSFCSQTELAHKAPQKSRQAERGGYACASVQQHHARVKDGGSGKCIQIDGGKYENKNQCNNKLIEA